MPYLIYGKHTKEWWDGKMRQPPDKTFRALNYKGVRVTKLEDAGSFAEKSDAEEYLAKKKDPSRTDVVFEIRKVK